MVPIHRVLACFVVSIGLIGCGTPDTYQPILPPTNTPVAIVVTTTPTPFAKRIPATLVIPTILPTVQPSATQIQLAPPTRTPPTGADTPASRQSDRAVVIPTADPAQPTLPIALVEPLPAPEVGAVLPDTLRERVLTDLAQRAGIDRSSIRLESVEAIIWNDGSLACPEPNVEYTQAPVAGFRVILGAAGVQYDYRVPLHGMFKLCG